MAKFAASERAKAIALRGADRTRKGVALRGGALRVRVTAHGRMFNSKACYFPPRPFFSRLPAGTAAGVFSALMGGVEAAAIGVAATVTTGNAAAGAGAGAAGVAVARGSGGSDCCDCNSAGTDGRYLRINY